MDYNKERHERISRSLGITVPEKERVTIDKIESWSGTVIYAAVVLTLVALFHFFFAIIRVDGPSMNNTLHDGQITLLSRRSSVKRSDIVVLKERLTDGGESKNIIKRVIGMPGDRVTASGGKIYINNEELAEPYLSEENIKDFKQVNWDIRVPEDHYFVLGDNRDVSKDSRAVGSFEKSSVVGVKIW